MLLKDKGVALRGLFVINPEGILEQATINNLPIGRSVDETLRLLQAIQFTAEHGEVGLVFPPIAYLPVLGSLLYGWSVCYVGDHTFELISVSVHALHKFDLYMLCGSL